MKEDELCGCGQKCSRKIVGIESFHFQKESDGMSDHYLVQGKLRVGMKGERAKQAGCVRKVLKVSELDKREKIT